MDYSIRDSIIRCPLGIEGEIVAQDIAKFELVVSLFVRVPTSKVVTRLSRGGGFLSGVSYELRFNIAAALGIKSNPVAVCYDGVKIDRAALNVGNFPDLLVIFCPANNCLFSTYGNEQCRTIKIFTAERAFRRQHFSSDDASVAASAVHEVDVTHRNKLGVEVYVSAIRCDRDWGSERGERLITIVPAIKFVAFLLRSSRNVERFVVLDDLRVIGCFVTFIEIEIIGDILVSIRSDDSHDCRICRQHVERQ